MDWPVSLWNTLGVGVARVRQAVAAADRWLAALHLISCETCVTAAAVVGALCRNEDMSLILERHFKWNSCPTWAMCVCVVVGWYAMGGLTTELEQMELAAQPLLGSLHSSMSSQTWNDECRMGIFFQRFVFIIVFAIFFVFFWFQGSNNYLLQ